MPLIPRYSQRMRNHVLVLGDMLVVQIGPVDVYKYRDYITCIWGDNVPHDRVVGRVGRLYQLRHCPHADAVIAYCVLQGWDTEDGE